MILELQLAAIWGLLRSQKCLSAGEIKEERRDKFELGD